MKILMLFPILCISPLGVGHMGPVGIEHRSKIVVPACANVRINFYFRMLWTSSRLIRHEVPSIRCDPSLWRIVVVGCEVFAMLRCCGVIRGMLGVWTYSKPVELLAPTLLARAVVPTLQCLFAQGRVAARSMRWSEQRAEKRDDLVGT